MREAFSIIQKWVSRALQAGVVLSCLIVIATGCDSKTVYNEHQDIEGAVWNEADTLFAQFEVSDTQHYHSVYLESRFSSEYKFSNIYFKVMLHGPGGQNMVKVNNFQITDKAGKWLGKGFGNLHSYSFPVLENLPLKQKGIYKVKLVPYMRIPELPGIHDRGIKVSKGKEIF